jgi:hypothetical protein
VGLSQDQKAMLRLLAQREQGYGDIAALTDQSIEQVRGKVADAVAALEGSEPPADDQRAILRLLAQQEQGYGDIAALTGQTVDEVRGKVAVALAALDGSPAAAASPPPPPERPAAEPPPAVEKPRPAAEKAAPARKPPRVEKPSSPGRPRPQLRLPKDRGAAWGLGAGIAVVLVLVVLLATGALGGSDSGGSGAGGGGEGSLKPTQAVLKPVGGGGARGRALFAKSGKQVVVVVRAKGLDPAPNGMAYTISVAKSSSERLPLIATEVNKAGEITGTIPIAPQVLGFVASGFDEMEISLVSAGELSSALKVARRLKKVPNYRGTPVLRGAITGAIVEAGEQGKVNP